MSPLGDSVAASPLLTTELVAALSTLRLRSRAVARGVLAGLHRSPRHGQSVEFAEYKEYSPGDDLRTIDWRAYGRLDRYYVRRFEQETHTRGELLLDGSASMGYGAPASKLRYSATIAAALGYLLVQQQDAVGLTVADAAKGERLPARSTQSHLAQLVRTLGALRAEGLDRLAAAAATLGATLRQPSLVLAFSDLLGGWQEPLRQLGHLRARGHEVVLLHVLHPDELTFPFEGPTELEELEPSGARAARWLVDGAPSRERYLAKLRAYLDNLRRASASAGLAYHQLSTALSPLRALQGIVRRP